MWGRRRECRVGPLYSALTARSCLCPCLKGGCYVTVPSPARPSALPPPPLPLVFYILNLVSLKVSCFLNLHFLSCFLDTGSNTTEWIYKVAFLCHLQLFIAFEEKHRRDFLFILALQNDYTVLYSQNSCGKMLITLQFYITFIIKHEEM